MATSGKAYAISVAIYAAVLVVIFILFSLWRRLGFTRKFFAPKRYVAEDGYSPPPKLPETFLGWVPSVTSLKEAQIIASAGIDAALYLKFLRMGIETFLVITVLACAIILPINITNDTVDQLMNAQTLPPEPPGSSYVYWIPPPPPPSPGVDPNATPDNKESVTSLPEAPEFYNDTGLPPAPPGVEWHKYANGVPPLPPAPPGTVWYYSADNVAADYYFTDLDKTTLSNIPESSPKMIAHAIVFWAITFWVFYQLWRYSKEALRLRMFYLLNAPRGAESHTVLCTDIPAVAYGTIPNRLDGTLLKLVPKSVKDQAYKQVAALDDNVSAVNPADGNEAAATAADASAADLISSKATAVDAATGRWEIPDRWGEAVEGVQSQGTVKGMVDQEFEKIYQSDFSHSHMAYDTSALDKLVAQYNATAQAAADLVDDYISKKSRGLELKPKIITVIGAKLGAWGREKYGMGPKKVDALEFYKERLEYLRSEITTAQKESKEKVFPSAFVTFNRRTAQVIASGSLMCEDLTAWTCQAAPRPTEIYWPNLGMRTWERSARTNIMWVAFIVLTLFYLIPVSAIQALLSTNASVGFIQDIPIVSSIITAILPGLVLAIFIALLPPIIKAMNKFSGMISFSEIDLSLMTKFFIFQVVTVFFGSFIAGSAANQFKQLVNDPGSIVTLLGTAAPQTAIFFMTYVTLRALFIVPFSVLRLVPFIIFWIKTKFLAATERAKARLWAKQMFSYGTIVPQDTIVALLGMTFCLICPIIAPVTLIYFCTSYIVRKYNLIYVFRQPYQAGAMAWKRMFGQYCTGLIIAQLVLLCLLALKKSIAGPIIMIPLPFLTLVFMRAATSTFWRPMQSLSLMAAADIDAKEGELPPIDSAPAPVPTLTPAASNVAAAMLSDAPIITDPSDLYLSPSFNMDAAAHAALIDDCTRMKAVLDGTSTDEKLFDRDAIDEFEELPDPAAGDKVDVSVAGEEIV